jgi:hypothetical protein
VDQLGEIGVSLDAMEWLLGALSLLGNPNDEHTLDAQLAQVRRLVTTHAVKGGHVDMD